MNKERKKQLRIEVHDLQEKHCDSCELNPSYDEDYTENRKNLLVYCRTQCNIGKRMIEIGKELLS